MTVASQTEKRECRPKRLHCWQSVPVLLNGAAEFLTASIADTIIRIRKETGRGYTKIVQAMRRLGHRISRQTVKNILVEALLGPAPNDHPDTWSDFLKRHAATKWQCDFASKRKWTIKGMVDLYFLVFIHVESRRIWVSPCTANLNGEWTMQQARNFDMFFQDEGLLCVFPAQEEHLLPWTRSHWRLTA